MFGERKEHNETTDHEEHFHATSAVTYEPYKDRMGGGRQSASYRQLAQGVEEEHNKDRYKAEPVYLGNVGTSGGDSM
jgi:hypothetical protein